MKTDRQEQSVLYDDCEGTNDKDEEEEDLRRRSKSF